MRKYSIAKMVKILSVLMTSLILSNTFSVSAEIKPKSVNDLDKMFAEQVKPNSIREVVVNEYTVIKSLQEKTNEELSESGFSDDEIAKLREFDYEKELRKRSELNISELKEIGYTDNEIKLLKSKEEEWTEQDIEERAATLRLRMGINSVTNSARDWHIFYIWNWSGGIPFFVGEDILGVSCVGSREGFMAAPTILQTSTATAQYYHYGGQYSHDETKNFKRVEEFLAESTFSLQTTNDAYEHKIAQSGYGTITISNTEPMDKLTVRLKYGHSTMTVTPSVNVDSTGVSGSFQFSRGVSIEADLLGVYLPDGSIVP
ncbi:hypothetical protein [Clostridium celatum]|uniref:hypothetical protein n=3 Tax=Clostridium celatum TaxID=36834 RepID=UPI001899D63A|nr:hypothetical protein [Clostridium celatum]